MSPARISIDAVLARDAAGRSRLLPARGAACHSCGLCGATPAADAAAATVTLSLPARTLAAVAIGMYGIPLAGLLAGALLAAVLGANDAVAAVAAVVGCLVSMRLTAMPLRHVERRTIGEVQARPTGRAGQPPAQLTADLAQALH